MAQKYSGESFQQRLPGKWEHAKNVFKFQISGNAENIMLSLGAVLQDKEKSYQLFVLKNVWYKTNKVKMF